MNATATREPTAPPPITLTLVLAPEEADALDTIACFADTIVREAKGVFKNLELVTPICKTIRAALREYV